MIIGMTNVKDLFRFRKPQLSEGELALVDRARSARGRIDACRTRFESIEMLFTTSSDDALILCRHLYRDILDAFSELYSINDRGGSVGSKSRLDAVPEGGTRALLAEMEQWLGEGSEERPSPDDIRPSDSAAWTYSRIAPGSLGISRCGKLTPSRIYKSFADTSLTFLRSLVVRSAPTSAPELAEANVTR